MSFQVGDVVECLVDLFPVKKGDKGTVIEVRTERQRQFGFDYLVKFPSFGQTFVNEHEIVAFGDRDYWRDRALNAERELKLIREILK